MRRMPATRPQVFATRHGGGRSAIVYESAGNGGIVKGRLQMLHVHILLVAPLGTGHMAQPGTDQHEGGVVVREDAYHTDPAANLPIRPLNHFVGANTRVQCSLNCTPIVRRYDILNNKRECITMPKWIPNKRYTPEFKEQVVEAVIQDGPSYQEAADFTKFKDMTAFKVGNEFIWRKERKVLRLNAEDAGVQAGRRNCRVQWKRICPPRFSDCAQKTHT